MLLLNPVNESTGDSAFVHNKSTLNPNSHCFIFLMKSVFLLFFLTPFLSHSFCFIQIPEYWKYPTTADRQGSYRYFFIGINLKCLLLKQKQKQNKTHNDVLMSHTQTHKSQSHHQSIKHFFSTNQTICSSNIR